MTGKDHRGLRTKQPQASIPAVEHLTTPELGIGLYSPQDVARLAHMDVGKVRKWLEGYRYRDDDGASRSAGPVVRPTIAPMEGRRALSFRDLIEVYWVREFLRRGISMHAIRKAAAEAQELLHDDHPFCLSKFSTAGEDIFATVLDERERARIIRLGHHQFAFSEVVGPLLQELEYAEAGKRGVVRWWPLGLKGEVVLDPAIAFGQPTTRDTAVPTDVLYKALLAERSAETVARWFQVSDAAVEAARVFEERLQRPS